MTEDPYNHPEHDSPWARETWPLERDLDATLADRADELDSYAAMGVTLENLVSVVDDADDAADEPDGSDPGGQYPDLCPTCGMAGTCDNCQPEPDKPSPTALAFLAWVRPNKRGPYPASVPFSDLIGGATP